MPPAIGAITFLTLTGVFKTLGEELESIKRAGVDGVALRKIGKGAEPTQVETMVDVLDAAAVKTLEAAYQALRGTVVTVTDGRGQTFSNIVVVDVAIEVVRPVAMFVGGGNPDPAFMVRAVWVLQPTEVPS